jgi:hypothetical protein
VTEETTEQRNVNCVPSRDMDTDCFRKRRAIFGATIKFIKT